MMSHFRFVIAISFFTAVAILVIHLRNVESRSFYKLCSIMAEQKRIQHQIWRKQLQVESLLNPASVSSYVEKDNQQQSD